MRFAFDRSRRPQYDTFRWSLIVVRDLPQGFNSTEDADDAVDGVCDRLKDVFSENHLSRYCVKIRTWIRPSDSTKFHAHGIRRKFLFDDNQWIVWENICVDRLDQGKIASQLSFLCNKTSDKMIAVSQNVNWILQLQLAWLIIPWISHSSTQEEVEEIISPGSVWYINRGGW